MALTEMVVLIQALVQGIMVGVMYGLMGLGITMVFAITRLLNFSHGDFMALAMYVCLLLYQQLGLDPYASSGLVAALFVPMGGLVFALLFKRVLRAHILMVIQLTLGLVFIIENGLLLGFGADYRSIPTVLTAKKVHIGPLILRAPHLAAFVIGSALALALFWTLKYTDLGRAIRAISQNVEGAKVVGLNVERVQLIVFSGAIGLLGLVGPLLVPMITMTPFMGLHLTLFSFIVFVMGGVGNFLGTMLAGLVLGIAESLGQLYIGGNLGLVVPYGVFVLVLLVRPAGLLGAKQ